MLLLLLLLRRMLLLVRVIVLRMQWHHFLAALDTAADAAAASAAASLAHHATLCRRVVRVFIFCVDVWSCFFFSGAGLRRRRVDGGGVGMYIERERAAQ